jgi:uncharacterized protein (UPF0276 family)
VIAHGTLSGVGIGLRAAHVEAFMEERPSVPWLEALADNYLEEGCPARRALLAIRHDYPVGLHAVGLSLGSTDPLDEAYLRRLAALAHEVEAVVVSEHLAWVSVGGVFAHDLLPLPCTSEVLDHLVPRVERAQEVLGQQICLENPSRYLRFASDAMSLAEFMGELVERTGCRLLLDLTNAWISERNVDDDARAFVDALPPASIAYLHLAGPSEQTDHVLDSHSAPVPDDVWALYRHALERLGPRPALIEWDQDIPALEVLLGEARRAEEIAQELQS